MTLNLNTPNKQWLMYLNTLSSISGDDLTIKPDTRRNLLLEVSGNNNIFIKKGDISYNLTNLIRGDASFSNVDVSANLNPLLTNNSSLGLPSKVWGNAYIRDISVTNISVSGNMTISGISNVIQIIPRLANDISLGSTTNIWQRAFIRDLSSINSINGITWPITGPAGPTGPAGTTTTATWRDISNLTLTTYHRIYQEISGDISWNAVTGYYGLAKDAYPSLNPSSSGVKSVLGGWTWVSSGQNANVGGICWSPELGIFVSVGELQTRIRTSNNGINWIPRTPPVSLPMSGVCWSSELNRFVAVSYNTNIVLTSINGITWSQNTAHTGNWTDVCWSPQLRIFVAVAPDGNNKIMTSANGITNWVVRTIEDTGWVTNDYLARICWSAELGMFAMVNTGNPAVLTSSNGINWKVRSVNNLSVWGGATICWSKELGIFVAVGEGGIGIISSNGINWSVVQINISTFFISVSWSPQLGIFVAFAADRWIATSSDGINWTQRTFDRNITYFQTSCWSPELGLFIVAGSTGWVYSSLKGCPPTSYNVFDNTSTILSGTGIGSGGIITTNGSYTIHSFTNVGTTTFTVPSPCSIEYLVIAGGGSGGSGRGGGGGAGGVLSGSTTLQAGSYTITVGAGGASTSNDNQGIDGESSSIGTLIVATGGGGGGGWQIRSGRNGGSGGGVCAPTSASPGTGINGQGFSGASQASDNAGGGGGGAGGSGSGSTGGIGISTTIRGSLEYYAGGGGAGGYGNEYGLAYGGVYAQSYGTYGGGNGSDGSRPNYQDAKPNTGGGGGGQITYYSGAGGSGIVIIRYIPTITISTNSINENGKWDFSNINVTTLNVTGTSTGTSDDRLKHNEIVITNGLEIVDRLTPKFYQKTQVLLDAHYNGDLSAYAWSYEAGLIAQEVLQISDLSFVVGGGDYYEQKYIYKRQTNEVSYNYYEPSANNFELSNNYYKQRANNYEISYNLIAQAYNLNYNSVFVYGLAAIKELHTKVKAQESTILNQKNIISSLLARIQALEK
jgi:hypothetical protein